MDEAQVIGKIDALVGRLDALLDQQQTTGTHQHQTVSGGGFVAGFAVGCSLLTIFLMVAFMVIENRSYAHLDNQVDQLKAWNDVHSKEIARLQAQQQKGG